MAKQQSINHVGSKLSSPINKSLNILFASTARHHQCRSPRARNANTLGIAQGTGLGTSCSCISSFAGAHCFKCIFQCTSLAPLCVDAPFFVAFSLICSSCFAS